MKVFAVSFLVLVVIALAFLTYLTPAFSRVNTVGAQTDEQSGVPPDTGGGTSALEQRVSELETQVSELQSSPDFPAGQAAGVGSVAILFGAFCALWAQNTGRNSWLWFFLGLFFNVLAILALLVRNSDDKTAA